MDRIVLENEYLRMEICNPLNRYDKHLHTRYSHCGYIARLIDKATGCDLLGSPENEFKPFSGEGFPDEFETPLNYDSAAVGDCFVKIGVGLEKRLSDKAYTNWDEHPISTYANTTVSYESNAVSFHQKLCQGDFSYIYKKTISLEERSFTISHYLKNDGIIPWKTLWYPHAFIPVSLYGGMVKLQMNEGCLLKHKPKVLTEVDDSVYINTNGQTNAGICIQWKGADRQHNYQRLLKANGDLILSYEGGYASREVQVYFNDRILSIEPKLIIELQPMDNKTWSVRHLING